MSTAEESLRFSCLFEAELLLELMLRYWEHPLGADKDFRQDLIENAAEVLKHSVDGEMLMEDIKPEEMNFVAAVWYVEWRQITDEPGHDPGGKRAAWLEKVRKAVPSCFCGQNDLM